MRCGRYASMQQMWKRLKKDNAGSYTVEAAYIIPLSLFLFILLFTIAFFLFNRCSLERATIVSALRSSEAVFSSAQEKYSIANDSINDVLSNNLLFAGDVSSEIDIQGNHIKIHLNTQEKDNTFVTISEKKVLNPVLFVREYRKIREVIK